jgi:hypothetical protein
MGAPLDLLRSLAATGVSKRSHPGKLRATTEEEGAAVRRIPPPHLTAGQNIAAGRAAPGIAWGEPMKISDSMRRTVGNRREVKREVKREQEGG